MIINNNIPSIKIANNLRIVDLRLKKTTEKISSGYKINSAADDPSGLAVSEKLRAQITGLKRASENALDGIHFIQTAEGALINTETIIKRIRQLAVQAANGIYNNEDRLQIQYEIDSLIDEIDRISKDTEFNTLKLLRGAFRRDPENTNYLKVINETRPYDPKSADPGVRPLNNLVQDPLAHPPLSSGTTRAVGAPIAASPDGATTTATPAASSGASSGGGGVYLHIGPNTDQRIKVYIENISSFNLGLSQAVNPDGTIKSSLDYSNVEGANAAIGVLDTALHIVSRERANLGAYQNRLEHTINYLENANINLQAAESQIRDTDIPKEISNFIRDKILLEASSSILSHSNVRSQVLLKLLNI